MNEGVPLLPWRAADREKSDAGSNASGARKKRGAGSVCVSRTGRACAFRCPRWPPRLALRRGRESREGADGHAAPAFLLRECSRVKYRQVSTATPLFTPRPNTHKQPARPPTHKHRTRSPMEPTPRLTRARARAVPAHTAAGQEDKLSSTPGGNKAASTPVAPPPAAARPAFGERTNQVCCDVESRGVRGREDPVSERGIRNGERTLSSQPALSSSELLLPAPGWRGHDPAPPPGGRRVLFPVPVPDRRGRHPAGPAAPG